MSRFIEVKCREDLGRGPASLVQQCIDGGMPIRLLPTFDPYGEPNYVFTEPGVLEAMADNDPFVRTFRWHPK